MAPLLQVARLAKAFGPIRAVDGVSFSIEPAEVYGLLGPNGAGKTTTLSMVCGLLRPDSGSVAIQGTDFWADPVRAKRVLGVVSQDLALYEELTGRENLEFWGRLAGLDGKSAKARASELLESLHLADRAREPVKKYSGGMKRRINLGAALMHRPKLLLLDEPTVGIDPQARASVLEFIRSLAASGTAVLYTTHYLEEAEAFCHRIGIIDGGKLLAEGTLAQLQAGAGGDRIYVLEGALEGADPDAWPGFRERFRCLNRTERQLMVASSTPRDPSECLRDLLALPVTIENVTLKKPSLNDVFLRLTGRGLRE